MGEGYTFPLLNPGYSMNSTRANARNLLYLQQHGYSLIDTKEILNNYPPHRPK